MLRVHDPDVITAAIPAGRLVSQPFSIFAPPDEPVAGVAICKQSGCGIQRIEQINLVELTAFPIHGDGQFTPSALALDLAHRILEPADLPAGAAGGPQEVNLVDIAEAGTGIKAFITLGPVQECGKTHVLILIESCHQLGRNLRHTLQNQLSIVGGPLLNIREPWLRHRQAKNHRGGACCPV